MLLVADIGNRETALGLLDGLDVVAHWRVSTDEQRTADEWAVLVGGLLTDAGAGLSGVVVGSTVPTVLHEWREMLTGRYSTLPWLVVEPGTRTGLPILTDNPREVGADRICNAVAATHQWGGPAVVVDFGTATTFDVITPRGEYIGGAIAPGVEISLEALGNRGAQLRQVELRRPRSVIAKNTIEALQSGLVFGIASQVEGMVGRIIDEMAVPAGEVSVVATGHLAPMVLEECSCFTDHEPFLTLRGLALVFNRNQSR